MKQPIHVGTWVVAVTQEMDLIKWGKDGDTEFPYPPDDKDAAAQAKHLATCELHKHDRLYILHVFNNGQMKTFDYEG